MAKLAVVPGFESPLMRPVVDRVVGRDKLGGLPSILTSLSERGLRQLVRLTAGFHRSGHLGGLDASASLAPGALDRGQRDVERFGRGLLLRLSLRNQRRSATHGLTERCTPVTLDLGQDVAILVRQPKLPTHQLRALARRHQAILVDYDSLLFVVHVSLRVDHRPVAGTNPLVAD